MQFKFFTIPAFSPEQNEDELNKFLRSHRVLHVERHFHPDKGYWSFAVEYVDQNPKAEAPPQHRKEKTDYTIGMTDEEKERYKQFKDIRLQLATEKGIPAYLVFTNEELSTLARLPLLDAETVKNVKGIAPSRLNDYAGFFYTMNEDEEGGQLNAADSMS